MVNRRLPLFLTWLILFHTVPFVSGMPHPVAAQAVPDLVTVFGSCQVKASGRLFVFLVDSAQFSVPMTGIRVFEQEIGTGTVTSTIAWSFQVPSDWYGIRAYLDTNGNRQLDRGIFGPAEPWGMSWQKQRPPMFPKFTDIAFLARQDFCCNSITVE